MQTIERSSQQRYFGPFQCVISRKGRKMIDNHRLGLFTDVVLELNDPINSPPLRSGQTRFVGTNSTDGRESRPLMLAIADLRDRRLLDASDGLGASLLKIPSLNGSLTASTAFIVFAGLSGKIGSYRVLVRWLIAAQGHRSKPSIASRTPCEDRNVLIHLPAS